MKLPIFGGVLSPQNMVRVKGGGVLKYAGGLMGWIMEKHLSRVGELL